MIFPIVQSGNSGGGGSGWTGTVTNYASLPAASDNNGIVYNVQNSTGFLWNRRKGLYESDGATWTRLSNVTFQAQDNQSVFVDDGDNTKKMDFQLSDITAGNTRTITMADRAVALIKLYPQQVRTVAKSGGDFTTVQAALDDIGDATSTKRYVILISPGRYNEQITPVEYVTCFNPGNPEDVEIYFDGKVIDITAQAYTAWYNIYINCTATSNNLDTIEIDAGEHEFFHCKIEWQSATDTTRGRIFDLNGGTLELEHSYIVYNYSSAVGSEIPHFMDIDGDANYTIIDCDFVMNVASDSGTRSIDDNSSSSGIVWIKDSRFQLNFSHATYSKTAFLYRQVGTSADREIQNNQFHIHNTGGGAGGTGTAIWLNSGGNSGVVCLHSNDIKIDGFGSNRAFQNDATDIINSTFDNLDTGSPDSISGTLNIDSYKISEGHLLNTPFIFGKAETGQGIKVDIITPTYPWRDIIGEINIRGIGANNPNWNVYRGNVRGYQFSVNDECWIEYHMPHDYLPGSDIFIHAHWSIIVNTVTSGAVTWDFEVTYAKGHDQANFIAPITATIPQNANYADEQYRHMIAEVQLSDSAPSGAELDSDDLEVDGIILVRTILSANTLNGTPEPFLHYVDIHYQSTGIGTKQKAPPFWT